MSKKREQVREIAEQVTDIVTEEVDKVNLLMEHVMTNAQEDQMKMLKAIFKMTSMSTLMQATKLALDMDEGK